MKPKKDMNSILTKSSMTIKELNVLFNNREESIAKT